MNEESKENDYIIKDKRAASKEENLNANLENGASTEKPNKEERENILIDTFLEFSSKTIPSEDGKIIINYGDFLRTLSKEEIDNFNREAVIVYIFAIREACFSRKIPDRIFNLYVRQIYVRTLLFNKKYALPEYEGLMQQRLYEYGKILEKISKIKNEKEGSTIMMNFGHTASKNALGYEEPLTIAPLLTVLYTCTHAGVLDFFDNMINKGFLNTDIL